MTTFDIAFVIFIAVSFFAVSEKTVRNVHINIVMNRMMIMIMSRFCEFEDN
jgi:hypothetical protein